MGQEDLEDQVVLEAQVDPENLADLESLVALVVQVDRKDLEA